MEYSTVLLSLIFAWACLHILLRFASFRGKFAPGPFPLPIFGNLFKLSNKPHESLARLAKTYGSLMSLKLGSVTCIVVSSASMAKEVLQKNDHVFSGRIIPDAMRVDGYPQASIAWSQPSSHWRSLRKLSTSQIFATHRLDADEGLRLMKVKDLINYVRACSRSRQSVTIGQAAFSTFLNVISNAIFSIDLASFNSESTQNLKSVMWGLLEVAARPNMVDYFPLLRPFDPQGVRRRTAIYFEKLDKIFDTLVDQRKQCKEQDAPKDLLDVLLHHTKEDGVKLSRVDLNSVFKDLFIAGADTGSSTVEWAMSELLRHRHIMEKARLELIENCSKDQPIKDSDIARLPYLQAIVKETLRLHPPGPLLAHHRAETSIELCGFTVPRHAQVVINLWAIGRDPDNWVNPTNFMPERFLGSNIDFKGRDFEFIPFGAGRRICPGLPLASRMVPLILGSLLQSFDWELEDGMNSEDINMEEKLGLTLQRAKQLCAIPVES